MSIQTAELFEDNEQYNEAFEEYKKLYQRNKSDLNILERLGHISMLLGDKEQAADYYSKILELDATNTMAYEQLMDIYVSTDKYKYYVYRGNLHSVEHQLEHAINDYKKALSNAQEEKQMVSARFVLASLYEQTGQSLKAIDEYLKVLDFEETPEEVYMKLANLYLKEDFLSSAIEVLERAVSRDLDSDKVKEGLSQLYLKNGQCEKAKEFTQDDLMKIKCLLEDEKKEEAYKLIQNLDPKYKTSSQYFSLLAQYYFLNNEFDKALENVEEFNKLEQNSPLTFQMRALIYENKKDDYNAHVNWGKYNIIRGEKDIAINEFLNAYQVKDTDPNLITSIAVLLEESGDKNHSMEFYEKLAELEPQNRKALEKLADFRESIGDYRAQCDYLEKLYETDKRNAPVIKKLAQTYEKLRNKPSAIEFYNKYLQYGKSSEDYEQIKQKVAKLEHTDMQEDEGFIDKIMKLFGK